MEISVSTLAPVILRSFGSTAPVIIKSILTFIFFFSDKALNFLADRSNLFKAIRYAVVSSYLYSLRVLPSSVLSLLPNQDKLSFNYSRKLLITDQNRVGGAVVSSADAAASCGSGIGRALCHVLFLVNETPVNSRKYEVVRALAEKLIQENLQDGNDDLMKINCTVLCMAFSRTLNQLEVAMIEQSRGLGLGIGNGVGDIVNFSWITLILNTITYYIELVLSWCWKSPTADTSMSRKSAEKYAAELLWLAEKMATCRCGDEAVHKWASASNLAWLSLMTEPRLQGSLVKISAFLFKQARVLERKSSDEREDIKVNLLMLWIPLLCRGNMGTDSPLLSVSERKETEKVLDNIINSLKHKDDQEQVLALWLHHYTCCQSSDWPNLHDCYTGWYTASRQNMVYTNCNS